MVADEGLAVFLVVVLVAQPLHHSQWLPASRSNAVLNWHVDLEEAEDTRNPRLERISRTADAHKVILPRLAGAASLNVDACAAFSEKRCLGNCVNLQKNKIKLIV